jgi:hypothetical protein
MEADVEQILAAAQLSTEIFGQATETMNTYLTATSGYLLVAYFIGKNLTRLQAAIVTVLYGLFALFATIATVSYFENAFYFGHTYGVGRAPSWGSYGVSGLFCFGILACLKFMWDVRHPKTE